MHSAQSILNDLEVISNHLFDSSAGGHICIKWLVTYVILLLASKV